MCYVSIICDLIVCCHGCCLHLYVIPNYESEALIVARATCREWETPRELYVLSYQSSSSLKFTQQILIKYWLCSRFRIKCWEDVDPSLTSPLASPIGISN